MKRIALFVLLLAPLALAAQDGKTFLLETFDKKTIRANPTTQVAIRVAQWPGQNFLLWLPESVAGLWAQWDAAVAHQDFTRTKRGGLRWEFAGNPKAAIVAELAPRRSALLLEVQVRNVSDVELKQVSAQNCFHLSEAPDFACRDYSQVYIKTGGQWQSLAGLSVNDSLPMFYRPGFLESGREDTWKGRFASHNQKQRAEYPLIIVLSRDRKRAIATASEDYQCLFHNHGIEYLLCAHSQQAAIETLPPKARAVFRQMIYFVDGGIDEAVSAYERDVARKAIQR